MDFGRERLLCPSLCQYAYLVLLVRREGARLLQMGHSLCRIFKLGLGKIMATVEHQQATNLEAIGILLRYLSPLSFDCFRTDMTRGKKNNKQLKCSSLGDWREKSATGTMLPSDRITPTSLIPQTYYQHLCLLPLSPSTGYRRQQIEKRCVFSNSKLAFFFLFFFFFFFIWR